MKRSDMSMNHITKCTMKFTVVMTCSGSTFVIVSQHLRYQIQADQIEGMGLPNSYCCRPPFLGALDESLHAS